MPTRWNTQGRMGRPGAAVPLEPSRQRLPGARANCLRLPQRAIWPMADLVSVKIRGDRRDPAEPPRALREDRAEGAEASHQGREPPGDRGGAGGG